MPTRYLNLVIAHFEVSGFPETSKFLFGWWMRFWISGRRLLSPLDS